ncbi:MAG: tyrosine-type recombinase/integrase, partial [Pseudomonadota bacterium]
MAERDRSSHTEPSADLNALIKSFVNELSGAMRASPYTVRNYKRACEDFFAFLQGHRGEPPTLTLLRALEPGDVRAFLADRRRQGAGAATLRVDLSGLRRFFRFLRDRGLVDNDSAEVVKAPPQRQRLPRPIPAEKAIDLINSDAGGTPGNWIALRDYALLVLLYGAGLRISEALSLRRMDIPLGETLRIRGKGGKHREAPVLEIVREATSTYAQAIPFPAFDNDDPLFIGARGGALNARVAQRMVAERRRRLNLPETATPHALRH